MDSGSPDGLAQLAARTRRLALPGREGNDGDAGQFPGALRWQTRQGLYGYIMLASHDHVEYIGIGVYMCTYLYLKICLLHVFLCAEWCLASLGILNLNV